MSRAWSLAGALIAAWGLMAAMVVVATPARAESWEAIPVNPSVDIDYARPDAPGLLPVYEAVQKRRILEELQHFLAPLHLPHRLLLRTAQCDQINAFYNPGNRSLTLCYELVADAVKKAPETVSSDGFITREAAIFGEVVGVLLHEGGHMMFDMLDVPVFGREEDAADQNASFLALQFNKDVARTITKGFVYFSSQRSDPSGSMSAFADEHGTHSQRMYNSLCLGYGGDPQTFQEFIDRGWLPKERAQYCGEEFAQLKLAFVKTILPFIDRPLIQRVQQAEWLTPDELK
jgi:hypothetical protein